MSERMARFIRADGSSFEQLTAPVTCVEMAEPSQRHVTAVVSDMSDPDYHLPSFYLRITYQRDSAASVDGMDVFRESAREERTILHRSRRELMAELFGGDDEGSTR